MRAISCRQLSRCRLLLALAVMSVSIAGTAAEPSPLSGLRRVHPRLMATDESWAQLAARRQADAVLDAYCRGLEGQARTMLKEPPSERKLIGKRLLDKSRTALQRVMYWSFAYRQTGDQAFLDRAVVEMTAVAAFSDWNPSHFLDVAEMTTALAIGYDWLYTSLSEPQRTLIREAIVNKGLKAGVKPSGWHRATNNWNAVCNGGMVLGALAVADDEPEIAGAILALARTSHQIGMKEYAPDGIYPEGPGYWEYGTMYAVMMLAGLESAIGEDWDMPGRPGFLESAHWYLQATGPTGRVFNFSDGGDRPSFRPVLFWFSQRLDEPGLLAFQKQYVTAGQGADSRIAPLVAIWWPKAGIEQKIELPLFWSGKGSNPMAIFRESWRDPNSMYLAVKGGCPSNSHGHMDVGSFIFEADGVRWASDMHPQSYNTMEEKGLKIWGYSQNSDRWRLFRLGSFSHNIVTIGGQQQRVDGHAKVEPLTTAAGPAALVEMTKLYGDQARSVLRGIGWQADRTVLIQDELTGLAPGEKVRWAMMTEAAVECNGSRAMLRIGEKSLQAAIVGPPGAVFEVISGNPPDDGISAPNPGMSMLIVHAAADAGGELRLGVVMRPGRDGLAVPRALLPLREWQSPAAVKQ